MKIKQKLIPAIAMLVIASIALTTASLAWFTMSTKASVTSISLSAAAPSNILVKSTWGAADGDKTFTKSTIALAVGAGSQAVTDGYSNGTSLYPLVPVSSVTGINNSFFAARVVDGTGALTEGFDIGTDRAIKNAANVTTSQYFIDVPLSFITTGEGSVSLLLDYANTNVTIGGAGNLFKAARVAFLTTDGSDKSTTAAGVTNYIFAKNSTASDFVAISALKPDKTIDTTAAQPYMTTNTDVLTVAKFNGVGNVADAVGTPLIVRIWLEGQDTNCLAAGDTGDISVNLAFIDAAAVGA